MSDAFTPTLERFKLVHVGGHHSVFCDGAQHIWAYGGKAGLVPFSVRNVGKCDCAMFQEIRHLTASERERLERAYWSSVKVIA